MREKPAVVSANLGPKAIAFITHIHSKPAVVLNTEPGCSTELRHRAVADLLGVGLDAGLILGALHGVRR